MTYVRTKDGRILKSFRDEMSTPELEILIAQGILIPNDEIVSQSDSIKELCDEFVAFENGFLRPRLEFKNIDENVLDAFLHCVKMECPNADLFGSIWTKKGLIHVAKINEKGELELL